ncbi:MAG TPA: hypothetical protein VGQ63_14005 [Pseudolabrys sp.]|jgi:hypothetical protein|nr:hypothetical protein [Pseudolabrys sp.]
MTKSKNGSLKQRGDGTVNVTLDADAVKLLDVWIDSAEAEFGFRPTRSQGLRALVKRNVNPIPTSQRDPKDAAEGIDHCLLKYGNTAEVRKWFYEQTEQGTQ